MYTVQLRALEPEDLDIVYRIENDTRLWQWGADSQPYSRFTLRRYIESQVADIYRDGQLRLVATADGQAVALVDLTDFCPHHRRAEVGIVVLPEHQRKGIATAALQQLEAYARTRLNLACLYAYVGEANQPAEALFRSLGYTAVGRLPRWIEGKETAILFQRLLQA